MTTAGAYLIVKMFIAIIPKLPMRDKAVTEAFYIGKLGFRRFGTTNHVDYLMMEKGRTQLHFFLFAGLGSGPTTGRFTYAQKTSTPCIGTP